MRIELRLTGKTVNANHIRSASHRGFTLVLTLSLLVLLTMIGVGMMSLSSTTLRATTLQMDLSVARANAKMSLIMAINQLQRNTGSDTRITARADILDQTFPATLGVWNSWQGSDHDDNGRPKPPGADYRAAKEQRFVSWLMSGSDSSLADGKNPPNTAVGAGSVTLVGKGTVGSTDDAKRRQVHMLPQNITRPELQGSYGWWIAGENLKARLPQPYAPQEPSVTTWAIQGKSYAQADPKPFGFDALLDDPSFDDSTKVSPGQKTLNYRQTELLRDDGIASAQQHFADLSTCSMGLLTNSATGGWRKDLSLFTENSSLLSATGLPLFQVKPGEHLSFTLPSRESNQRTPHSLFYYWSDYRGTNEVPIYEHGAVTSWANLIDYANLYKRSLDQGSRIVPFSKPIDSSSTADRYDFLHRVRLLPVIARIQWVFSHSAIKPTDPAAPANSLTPALLLTPIVTLWNPYNMAMDCQPIRLEIIRSMPNAFQYTVNGIANTKYNGIIANAQNNTPTLCSADRLIYEIKTVGRLNPGETRLFSPRAGNIIDTPSQSLDLEPEYRGDGGHRFPVLDDQGKAFVVPAAATQKANAKFDTTYNDAGSLGVSVYIDMYVGPSGDPSLKRHLVYRMTTQPSVANSLYPPISNLAESQLSLAVTTPQPFLTTIFGARMASQTHMSAKGFVQSSPLVNYTAMGGKDSVESTIRFDYNGSEHPVNSPFDYSFRAITALDSLLPNASDDHGYIVTGFNKSDGLSRCIIAELPVCPLQSLPELQHWDLRYENPVAPFSFNIIGNSDASPILPADAVFNSSNQSKGAQDLQNDDSYCANHVLFDDWFFSSLAPQSDQLGAPTTATLQQCYRDFITNKKPLPNRSYQPIREDTQRALSSAAELDQLYQKHINNGTAWQRIASRLEVNGMFNVNSTSVTAWRALLGHARKQKTPFFKNGGQRGLSEAGDYAVNRFSIAGDVEAKQQGSSGVISEAAEFAGYRAFSDATLNELAQKIVAQIRLRGPFLSLSEFVNRQLTTGDLAIAGTVQAALNALATNPALDPYSEMEKFYGAPASPNPPGPSGYLFPAAAQGYNCYGLPGWTRQADLLRPLAPILSVRDDTFTIRAYGDARDSAGKIKASAVCEAVVRRTRDFLDSSDAADITTTPTKPINQLWGRRYAIVSFRWLHSDEI